MNAELAARLAVSGRGWLAAEKVEKKIPQPKYETTQTLSFTTLEKTTFIKQEWGALRKN